VLNIEPKTPPLVIVNVPPRRSSMESFPLWDLDHQLLDIFFDIGKRQLIGIADHRDDQTLLGANRHADVIVAF
jgi:hypothetical protein